MFKSSTLTQPLLWQNYFRPITRGSDFFTQQNKQCDRIAYFPKKFRFIDDLRTFSSDELDNNYNDIYSNQLKPKK